MYTLIFANQKGGCAKTTSALSVGSYLHRSGYKVLLIDSDAQGHLSKACGAAPDEKDITLYEVLRGSSAAAEAIRTAPGGYDVLPSDIRLTGADIQLASVPGRDFLLREALESVARNYDYAIIDAPPSLSVITLMGLAAADGVVITLKADYLALDGVAQLADTIQLVRRRLNPGLEITGILLTFFDGRKNLAKQIAERAEEGFPGKVFQTRISPGVALEEAPAARMDIFDYRPSSKQAAQYAALTAEIIARTT